MRVKENADDYRYFPDPDLVPLQLSPDWLDAQRAALPELPARRRARFEAEHGLSAYDARLLTESRPLADFFEAATVAHGSAKTVANWVLRDVLALLKESGRELDETALQPGALAALLARVDARRLTAQSARELLRELAERGGDVDALVRERGMEAVSDAGSLAPAVDEVLAANPEMVAKLRAGEDKVLNFLMGQVMKRTGGKADPAAVRALLLRRLGS
jgi:aspartyl-tRNA(Asn)/glutamyl-tRNA(Gln) amidotransferase subunit B